MGGMTQGDLFWNLNEVIIPADDAAGANDLNRHSDFGAPAAILSLLWSAPPWPRLLAVVGLFALLVVTVVMSETRPSMPNKGKQPSVLSWAGLHWSIRRLGHQVD